MTLKDITAGYGCGSTAEYKGLRPMTVAGTPQFNPGKVGKGFWKSGTGTMYRDGTDQSGITYANSWGTWSISCWFKADIVSGSYLAWGVENGDGSANLRQFYLSTNSGTLRLEMLGTAWTYVLGPALSTGVWYHAVVSMSAGTASLYVNGVFQASGSPSGQFATNRTNGWCIGGLRYNSTSNNVFQGMVDSVHLWLRALSATEVKKLYNYGVGTEYPFDNIPTLKSARKQYLGLVQAPRYMLERTRSRGQLGLIRAP